MQVQVANFIIGMTLKIPFAYEKNYEIKEIRILTDT